MLWGTLNKNDVEINEKYMKKYENNSSLVVGVKKLKFPILFLGDTNRVAQELLLKLSQENLKSYKGGILISGHHGLLNGLYEPLLELIRPSMIIVSRNKNKLFRHKEIQLLTRYTGKIDNGLKILKSECYNNNLYKSKETYYHLIRDSSWFN